MLPPLPPLPASTFLSDPGPFTDHSAAVAQERATWPQPSMGLDKEMHEILGLSTAVTGTGTGTGTGGLAAAVAATRDRLTHQSQSLHRSHGKEEDAVDLTGFGRSSIGIGGGRLSLSNNDHDVDFHEMHSMLERLSNMSMPCDDHARDATTATATATTATAAATTATTTAQSSSNVADSGCVVDHMLGVLDSMGSTALTTLTTDAELKQQLQQHDHHTTTSADDGRILARTLLNNVPMPDAARGALGSVAAVQLPATPASVPAPGPGAAPSFTATTSTTASGPSQILHMGDSTRSLTDLLDGLDAAAGAPPSQFVDHDARPSHLFRGQKDDSIAELLGSAAHSEMPMVVTTMPPLRPSMDKEDSFSQLFSAHVLQSVP
jgi:hypothetical protein